MPQEKEPLILADGHVHIHDCFDRQAFFEAALSNFYLAAAREQAEDSYQSVLFLTESQGRETFPLFSQSGPGTSKDPLPGWSFRKTREADSLVARDRFGRELILIAGYQIVTAEGLEVLGLGADRRDHLDGRPFREVIRTLSDRGGLPVIPWGFGKWIGQRGALLRSFLSGSVENPFFLGDNSGRPGIMPVPALFRIGAQKGISVLPGSDPLPFASETRRPGGFGFSLTGFLDPERPSREIKELLLNPAVKVKPFGRLETTARFFRNQWKMQLKKHFP
jgi:hypothetical protein